MLAFQFMRQSPGFARHLLGLLEVADAVSVPELANWGFRFYLWGCAIKLGFGAHRVEGPGLGSWGLGRDYRFKVSGFCLELSLRFSFKD